jgi:sulfur carrier protein
MNIQLNGEPRTLPAGDATLTPCSRPRPGGRRVAVEVNGEIVSPQPHGGHVLAEGDRVEIVHALGGG